MKNDRENTKEDKRNTSLRMSDGNNTINHPTSTFINEEFEGEVKEQLTS